MTIADTSPIRPPTRDRTSVALLGVVFAYALLNSFASWLLPKDVNDFLAIVVYTMLVFQPILFGVWTALGAGSIFTRLPLAIPCLLLVFVAPGYIPTSFADVQRNEFIAAILVGYAIYAISLIIFLVLRRFTGFRIQALSGEFSENVGAKYSIKDMLTLTTICAVALGLATKLKFQTDPPPASLIFGPDFFIRILVIGGAVLTGLVLPTIAVPMSILYGHPTRRVVKTTIAPWVAVTLLITIPLIINEVDDSLKLVGFALLAQLVAVVIGVLTALPLHYYGLRLTRPNQAESAGPPVGASNNRPSAA